MSGLIEVRDVHKTHAMGAREVQALDGVSLSVGRGEYVAIMGASGSGKTTLLHLMGCLDRPSRGQVAFDGTDLDVLDDDALSGLRNRSIGFVFQAFHLIPQLTVAENVELPLVYLGVEPELRAERAARLLARVGLASRSGHRPNQLSGGECQRAALARALIVEPLVVLADEPTGNLDSRTGDEIMALLETLHASGVAIVMVTHDPARARRADRLVNMRDGRIVATPEQPGKAWDA